MDLLLESAHHPLYEDTKIQILNIAVLALCLGHYSCPSIDLARGESLPLSLIRFVLYPVFSATSVATPLPQTASSVGRHNRRRFYLSFVSGLDYHCSILDLLID
jgi:hypothetical protein